MKKLFWFPAVLLCLCLALSVCASALSFDHSWVEGGNAYLGTFHVKDMPEEKLELWKRFMTTERLFAEQDNNHKIYFLEVPEGVSGKIVKNRAGSSFAYDVIFSPGFPLEALVFQYKASTGMYEYVGDYVSRNFQGFGLDAIIVNRGFSLTSDVPSSELYIPHEGLLYIVDDLGNEMEGDGESEPDPSWWKKLLDWLDSFWKKLRDFFVPKDGYFSDWFNEIKDAAMKKLTPISEVHKYLKDAFETLKNDTTDTGLYLDIPPNHFYDGFPGIRVNLLRGVGSLLDGVKTILTMICVIMTAIVCYRRIIVIFEK